MLPKAGYNASYLRYSMCSKVGKRYLKVRTVLSLLLYMRPSHASRLLHEPPISRMSSAGFRAFSRPPSDPSCPYLKGPGRLSRKLRLPRAPPAPPAHSHTQTRDTQKCVERRVRCSASHLHHRDHPLLGSTVQYTVHRHRNRHLNKPVHPPRSVDAGMPAVDIPHLGLPP